jgi:PAS domain S-box-containing protein
MMAQGIAPGDVANAVLHGVADAVVACDREGVIRFWNPGAARIFGFGAEEAVGRTLDIIIPERLRARHWDGYHATMRTGKSRYSGGDLLSVPALRKDGSTISVEFTIVPLADAQGGITGLAAVMRDITARFEELKSLRREIRALAPGPSARG